MSTQPSPNRSILYGVLCLAAGTGFIYYFIWRPLEAMAQKQEGLTYSLKGVGLGPFFILFGLYLLILRPPNMKPAQMSKQHRVMYWVVIAVSVVLGIVAFMWFKHRAGELGYNV